MPQKCVICEHVKRTEIDADLKAGVPGRKVAGKFGISEAGTRRHKQNHLFGAQNLSIRRVVEDLFPEPEDESLALAKRRLLASGQPFAWVELITPNIALALLDSMGPNRHVSWGKVEQFAADMEAGNWYVHGQGLSIDVDGILKDGQHRMWALLQTELSFYMVVTRNVSSAAMPAIDAGKVRRAADDNVLEGIENGARIAPPINLIAKLEKAAEKHIKLLSLGNIKLSRFQIRDIRDRLLAERDIMPSIRLASRLYSGTKVPQAAGAAAHFLGTRMYGEEFANAIMEALATGQGLIAGDPAMAARNRFNRLRDQRPKKPSEVYACIILKVMADEAAGNELQRIDVPNLENAPVSRWLR